MYEQSLEQAGLSTEQAIIYETLLENGPLTGGIIIRKTNIKRGLVYKVLDQLNNLELVEKVQVNKKPTIFRANHPLKIKDLIETKIKESKSADLAFNSIAPNLISDFNISSGQPGIEYYEGDSGIKKIAFDSLNTKSEILQYVDIESVQKYAKNLNKEYIKKRQKLKTKKRIIITGSQYNKEYFSKLNDTSISTKYINYNMKNVGAIMMIYDNKISYIALSENKKMGFIIDNPQLTELHRQLFNYTWLTSQTN